MHRFHGFFIICVIRVICGAEGFQTTLRTLREVVLRWHDETVCYPGHGAAFRLGDRRGDIEAFLRKDHGAFFGDATWEM